MRRLASILIATTLLAVLAAPAAAVKPDTETPEPFLIEGLCSFDVQLDFTAYRAKTKDFFDRDGNLVRTHYSGTIMITLTNLTSGRSIDANVGGPGFDYYNADGTITAVYLGRGIPLLTDSSLTAGRFEFLMNGDFTEVLAVPTANGKTWDFCELLA